MNVFSSDIKVIFLTRSRRENRWKRLVMVLKLVLDNADSRLSYLRGVKRLQLLEKCSALILDYVNF